MRRAEHRCAAICGLGALIALLALEGCSAGGPEAGLGTYLERLARPLETQRPALAVNAVAAPPRWTALQQKVAPASIDGFDFLKLRGCALQQTVARRNSSLGRVAPPSQRLLLELEFLERVDDCIAYQRERSEAELAQLLGDSAAQKRAQLPTLIFNATLGGEEYRDFWRGTQSPGSYPTQTSSAVINALEQITGSSRRWLAGDYGADGRIFELQLADIARGDGGELLAALALQAAHLDAASAMLRERALHRPLCVDGLRPASADILRNVATRFFVGEVQPWSAALGQRRHELLPPLQTLEARLAAVLPAEYQRWRADRDRSLVRWSAAPRDHVEALQLLLGGCFAEFAPAAQAQP